MDYEVEAIVDKRIKDDKNEYYVKWKDFSTDDSTWESEEFLMDIYPELLASFLEREEKKLAEANPKSDEYPQTDLGPQADVHPQTELIAHAEVHPQTELLKGETAQEPFPAALKRVTNTSSKSTRKKGFDRGLTAEMILGATNTPVNMDYEVEAIVDKRIKDDKNEYYVKWKDFSTDDSTWESEEFLMDIYPELLASFLEREEKKLAEANPKSDEYPQTDLGPQADVHPQTELIAHAEVHPQTELLKGETAQEPFPAALKRVTNTSSKSTRKKGFDRGLTAEMILGATNTPVNMDYEVEAIVDKRIKDDKNEYYVKWKDFSTDDSTWESEEFLMDIYPELLASFLEREENKLAEANPKSDEYPQTDLGPQADVHPQTELIAHAEVHPQTELLKGETAQEPFPAALKRVTNTSSKSTRKKGFDRGLTAEMILGATNTPVNMDYEVEAIVDKRIKDDKNEYYVKWKDFSTDDSTWEPEEFLMDIYPELLASFLEREEKKLAEANPKSDEYPQTDLGPQADVHPQTELIAHADVHPQTELVLPAEKSPQEGETAQESFPAALKRVIIMSSKSTRKVGFDRGLTAEMILGATNTPGELMFLMKWKEDKVPDLVRAKEANVKCPQVVIAFYENRLCFIPGVISASDSN